MRWNLLSTRTGRSPSGALYLSRPIRHGSSPRPGWPGNAKLMRTSQHDEAPCMSRPRTCLLTLTYSGPQRADADIRDPSTLRTGLEKPDAAAASYLRKEIG